MLRKHSNPFNLALQFFANASRYGIESLAATFFEVLLNLRKNLDDNVIKSCLDDNVKTIAFNFMWKKRLTVFKLTVEAFELLSSNSLFIADIRQLIDNRDFLKAGQLACELRLTLFNLDDLLIPLFLENKMTVFEELLDNTKHQQTAFIAFLDSLLAQPGSALSKCKPIIVKHNLKSIKEDMLTQKPIQTLINRLLDKYKLDKMLAPINLKLRINAKLHFILKHHYKGDYSGEKSSREAFEDNIKIHVSQDNIELQIELLRGCIGHNKFDDAIHFMESYQIPTSKVPHELVAYKKIGKVRPVQPKVVITVKPAPGNGWSDDETFDDKPKEYHKLSLENSKIVFIDTIVKFFSFLHDFESDVAGFDVENTSTDERSGASIIQLATRSSVHIIDVIALKEKLPEDCWNMLAQNIFNNKSIVKFGFDVKKDLKKLQEIRGTGIIELSDAYLDLKLLGTAAKKTPGFEFPFKEYCNTLSLTKLTKLCFGKGLNKGNQLSDWCKRPLSQDQIDYAALDAYVLIEIYDVMLQIAERNGIDFDELKKHSRYKN